MDGILYHWDSTFCHYGNHSVFIDPHDSLSAQNGARFHDVIPSAWIMIYSGHWELAIGCQEKGIKKNRSIEIGQAI